MADRSQQRIHLSKPRPQDAQEEMRDHAAIPSQNGRGGEEGLGIPVGAYLEKIGELERMSESQGALGLILIDGAPLYSIAERYGRQVYEGVLSRLARYLMDLRGVALRKADLITRLGPGQDQYLIFLSPKRVDRAFGPAHLETCAQRMQELLSSRLEDIVAPYLKAVPRVAVGYAFGLRSPRLDINALILRLIEEARMMARYQQFRRLTRGREKLQEVILKNAIRTVFQPILEIPSGAAIGYEALSRGPEDTEFERPDILFQTAGEAGLSMELDRLCRIKAIIRARHMPEGAKLFLNCLPAAVYHGEFEEQDLLGVLAGSGLEPSNIVLEISEREMIENYDLFCGAMRSLSRKGFCLAVDDVGSGYSSLELVAQLRPNFFKLDLSLVREIQKRPVKQALIRALTGLARDLGSEVVAEGIETVAELECLCGLGVSLGQGYLFARPSGDCRPTLPL